MARKKEIIGLVIFALMLGTVTLCFFPVSHSYLNRKTVEVFQKKWALDSCTVRKVSLTLFRGLLIHDLLCIKKIDREKSIRTEIPITRVDYRVLRTFRNWGKIQSSLKTTSKKRIKRKLINKKYLLNYLYTVILKSDTLIFSCINAIIFERVNVSIDSLGSRGAGIEKMRCTIHIAGEAPSLLKIKLSADKMTSKWIQALKPKVNMKLDGPHCVIKRFSCNSFGGKLDAEFDLNMLYNRINRAHITLKKADLEKIYLTLGGEEGSLNGKCNIELDIDTSTTEFSSLEAAGSVTLSKVSADQIPLITKIALLLGMEKLSHLSFKKIKGDFNIGEGKILVDSLDGDGDPLSLSMSGWVKPEDGYFNFKMSGIFESYYEDSMSAIAWNTLIPEDDGRRSFICTVYGTPDYPTVSLDRKLMRRAAKNIFQGLKDDLKSIFRKRR